MSRVFRVASGKVAVWDDHTNDAPFVNPLADAATLNRVKFHSSLSYVNIISTTAATLSLPARSNFQSASASYTLFAHGRPGVPFVLGYATVAGAPVAFTGSIPVQLGVRNSSSNGNFTGWFGRWITIGADATNVYAYEHAVAQWQTSSNYESYAALDVPLTIHVTNELL